MQHRVKRFDSRHSNAGFLCEFDGRTEISLDFHWPSGGVVLIHSAVRLCRRGHLLDRCFAEPRLEMAALGCCEIQEFINDSGNHRTDTDFLEKLGVRRRFEDHTCWMEGNRTVSVC